MKTLRNAGIASIVSLVVYIIGLIISYSTKDINQLKNFVINEIKNPLFDAQLVADEIAMALERMGNLKFKVIAYKKLQDIKVLDFGCGSGIFIEELKEKGFDYYGIDISAEAVRFGELKGIKNLGVIDSHKINFPKNLILIAFLRLHFPSPKAYIFLGKNPLAVL